MVQLNISRCVKSLFLFQALIRILNTKSLYSSTYIQCYNASCHICTRNWLIPFGSFRIKTKIFLHPFPPSFTYFNLTPHSQEKVVNWWSKVWVVVRWMHLVQLVKFFKFAFKGARLWLTNAGKLAFKALYKRNIVKNKFSVYNITIWNKLQMQNSLGIPKMPLEILFKLTLFYKRF